MRIAFLAQKIIASSEESESFRVFQQLAEATAHIPILEDWALLERSEQKRLTGEREKIEKIIVNLLQRARISSPNYA